MDFVMDKLRILCQHLDDQRKSSLQCLDSLEYVTDEYKSGNTAPAEGWETFHPGTRLAGVDKHFWFRFDCDTPSLVDTRVFLRVTTGREGQWDGRNPQGLVYLNGHMTQGLDTNHTEVLLDGGRHYHVEIYFYTGLEPGSTDFLPELMTVDTRIEAAYYDFLVPYEALRHLSANSGDYARMRRVLEEAANLIDMRVPKNESYYATLSKARAFLDRELYHGPLCGRKDAPVVNCVGHTHIDVAWMWTYAQTKEKAQRSFSTVLQLMKEYPEYIFMSSQPQLYRYVKQEAPELYEEIRRRIKEGRWEADGAMWLEADCNLISGESMVRQILHGKKFFKDEFGVDSRVLWLPDVFGYSAAMPQILKKCGVDRFVTSKISWNETDCMPFDTFYWQGLDGTEILTDFLTAQDYPPDGKPATGTTYVANTDPGMVMGTWNRYQQKEYNDETVMTFGFGDGGGGPTRRMLEIQRRTACGLPGLPRTQMSTARGWLDRTRDNFTAACERLHKTPRWVGELYLEYHRGTYTSMAKNKRHNRKSEFLLQRTEALGVCDKLFCGQPYPSEELYGAWETVLRNQFHDVIPGSSIFEVYEDSDRQYAAVKKTVGALEEKSLAALAAAVPCGDGVFLFNPLSFARSGTITVDGVCAEVGPVPAYGWCMARPQTACRVAICGRALENDYYRLVLDEAGRLAELYDKRVGREVLRPGEKGNELQIFEDFPRDYDAWEISSYYKQKMWVLDDAAEITPVTDGSRAGLRVHRRYLNSDISQTVWLYSSLERIDFETVLDWHDEHQLLKAAFPLDVHAAKATYEIQFGHVERPTHENTSWDAAKFEVCGHKWADLSEDGYGVSLLNDCKYGHNAEGGTLKLTLLKCATYPNPQADKGRHEFTYSLLPHAEGWRAGHTVQEAYSLNQPLLALPVRQHTGLLPKTGSLVACSCENVLVDTLKAAEDGDGIVLRLYDAYDRRSRPTLTFGFDVESVWLCDMLENDLAELPVSGRCVTVPVGNFEVVTLRVRPAAGTSPKKV